MVRPDFAKWNQTPDDLLRLAREAEHPRNQERYMALYAIGTKASSASRWAEATGRENETVLGWIHQYNAKGPSAVLYRHSGGRPPFLPAKAKSRSSPSSKRVPPTTMACPVGAGR
jgi:transposase